MIALGVHQELDALAVRIARVWAIAIGEGALEAARNAVAPLAFDDEPREAALEASARAVLEHRRALDRSGFAQLDGLAIAMLVRHAADLLRTHPRRLSAPALEVS